MRTGTRLGIDVGKARIGIARCDPHGMLATPVETVTRDHEGTADLTRIGAIADELDVIEFVVGLPLNMQGKATPSTEDAREFAQAIARMHPQRSVRLVDERLSTVTAQAQLHQTGRNTKKSRSVIDQAAAVIILQQALDAERAQDRAPGTAVMAND